MKCTASNDTIIPVHDKRMMASQRAEVRSTEQQGSRLNIAITHVATRNLGCPRRLLHDLGARGARREHKESQMKQINSRRLILAACSILILSAGAALAGPCDTTGRSANRADAGSGPASQGSSQTTGMSNDRGQQPPTDTMNRASGDVATSSQDAQRQMQGQPTAAQQAEGAKPGGEMTAQEQQRQMHGQPSVAQQPKGMDQQTADKGC